MAIDLVGRDLHVEAIILDIGGVIAFDKDPPLSTKWASKCDLDAIAFDRIVFASEWFEQAVVGAISREEFWGNIGAELGLSGTDLADLVHDYWECTWNTVLLDYLRTLKAGYKLGIVSDAEPGAREMLAARVNGDLFDSVIFSSEEGVRKPDPRIFHTALDRLGVRANAAVFVDDKAANVVGAQRLGIHAFRYRSFPQFKESLHSYIDGE